MSAYDTAVSTLYQAPLSDFVAERKRLAAELKAAGDKEGAARVAKLARPSVSAWAVNQLWWREQAKFEALVTAASRVKAGERDASQLHRQALSQLRELSLGLLQEAGNAASETTLRRVTTTLSAVAAAGSFEPDAAGALSADRDPPGFETLGFGAQEARQTASAEAPTAEADAKRAEESERRRAEEAEKRRVDEAERQRRLAERERLSVLLRDAQRLRESRQGEVSRLRLELDLAEQSLQETQALLADLAGKLTSL